MKIQTKTEDVLIIKTKLDLRNHLNDGIGLVAVHHCLDGAVELESTYNCSAIEAEKIACNELL